MTKKKLTNPTMTPEWFASLTDVCVVPRIEGTWYRRRDNVPVKVHGYYAGGWVWYAQAGGPNTQQTYEGFINDYRK